MLQLVVLIGRASVLAGLGHFSARVASEMNSQRSFLDAGLTVDPDACA